MQVTKARESCIIVYAGTVRKTKKLLQTESILAHWEWAGSVERPLHHAGDKVPDIQEELSEALIFISDQHTPLIMSVSGQDARKMRQVQSRHSALTGRQAAPNPNQTKPKGKSLFSDAPCTCTGRT